jgi:hypothetical protein
MHLHNYYTMNNIREQMKVMSETPDIIVSSLLLQSINPRGAIELGAGSGGWPKTLYKIGGIDDCHWILFENFNWIENNFNDENYYWPTDEADFYRFLEQTAPGLKTTLISHDVNTVKNTNILSQTLNLHPNLAFDLLRLDCPIDWDIMEYCISVLSDDALVFIDDHRANCGMQRIIIGVDMVRKGLLFPVWFGEKEAVYCKNLNRANELKRIITDIIPKYYDNIFPTRQLHYTMPGETWEFVATTSFKVFTTGDK